MIKGILATVIVWGIGVWVIHVMSELGWWYSIGLSSTFLLIAWIIIHFTVKFKNRNNPEKEKYSYVLPYSVSRIFKTVDQQVQYEASMMAMFFMLLGFIGFSLYTIFFAGYSPWLKFFVGFNSFWGFVFMVSYLITTYQQYHHYMVTKEQFDNATDLLALPMKGGST